AHTLHPWQAEFRVKFPEGDVRWFYGNAVPETQPDGSTLWHGFANDISQRREADRAKAQLEEQLRQTQKVEAIGKLAGGVAHDFNNLLTVILGRCQLLLARLEPNSPLRRHVTLIDQTGVRAGRLTRQLLAFSRKQILQPTVLELDVLVGAMTEMLRRLIGEDIELITVPGQALGHVQADPAQL